jgi:hypothetical protein
MKIKRIKFYQSIKCNTIENNQKSELNYLDAEKDGYEVIYKDGLIYITLLKSKEVTITGMNNVVYMTCYEKTK